ncbi:MAG: tRNA preQ1(34) S-adenosylmethionine ribosyltransferase-isomerase QueA [bacterium]|nr:tRNA preQ1(34) S-adenosylmethionine ribosyltransferase-isomerase QueA [bacterium]
MKLQELDYKLPSSLIAYESLKKRSHSKLLTIKKESGKIKHEMFIDILDYLNPGDVLILNDTKVFPARLEGVDIANNSKVEALFLEKFISPNIWKSLIKPGKKLKIGNMFNFNNKIFAKIIEIIDKVAILELKYEGKILEILEQIGKVPLPPYIKREEREEDRIAYQTIYAREVGSIAAPTAGFHFTEELIKMIEKKGISIVFITLHVGWGTFKPIRSKNIEDHDMQSENYQINEEAAEVINKCKGRVVAVGTTVTRALESAYCEEVKEVLSGKRNTNIFIYPGYRFKVVDAVITNFHLPKSTILALVYAFAGKQLIQNAYQEAIEKEYRFYSFGDAMYIY